MTFCGILITCEHAISAVMKKQTTTFIRLDPPFARFALRFKLNHGDKSMHQTSIIWKERDIIRDRDITATLNAVENAKGKMLFRRNGINKIKIAKK